MNNLVIEGSVGVPAVQNSAVMAMLNQTQDAFVGDTGAYPTRMSFAGRSLWVHKNGEKEELPTRQADIVVVAINPKFHYAFYERAYGENETGHFMTRYPTAEDTSDFTPSKEWKQRQYKRRVLFMLANDPSCELYYADFSYGSDKKSGGVGYFSIVGLQGDITKKRKIDPNFAPFCQVVQMSFTQDSVPTLRFAIEKSKSVTQEQIDAAVDYWQNGTVQRMFELEYDSRNDEGGTEEDAPFSDDFPPTQSNDGLDAL